MELAHNGKHVHILFIGITRLGLEQIPKAEARSHDLQLGHQLLPESLASEPWSDRSKRRRTDNEGWGGQRGRLKREACRLNTLGGQKAKEVEFVKARRVLNYVKYFIYIYI